VSIVIVTNNQYIIASRIHHITLDESTDWRDIRNQNGRPISVKLDTYNITVVYTPEVSQNQGRNDDTRECVVTLRGKVDAYRVYKNLIRQIREQMPDQLFLDKVIEGLLTEEELTNIGLKEEQTLMEELYNDRSATKVRSPRKTKRTSKKVL
jgi:hypothetical protein